MPGSCFLRLRIGVLWRSSSSLFCAGGSSDHPQNLRAWAIIEGKLQPRSEFHESVIISLMAALAGQPSVILHVRIGYVYCTYNWHILSVLFRCMRSIIRAYTYDIRSIYGIDRILYGHDVYYTYSAVYVHMLYVYARI
jgi:hypothetical protein